MNYIDKVTKLQVEIGNFCNADCLGCVRTSERAKSRIQYDGHYFVEPDAFTNVFSSKAGQHIKEIEFCGNIDEPLAHPRFLKILDAIYEQNPNLTISIHTNGSTKTVSFYKELGERICKFNSKSKVRFSIDGHENSVWLYRGLKNYDEIIKHAQACIDTGAKCVWQMLSFPWNEHEVDSCEKLAKEMGFVRFILRRDRTDASKQSIKKIKQYRSNKNIKEFKHYPVDDYTIKHVKDNKLWEEFVTWDIDNSTIDCHFAKERMIFIDHKSRVWPCCFLANPELRSIPIRVESYLKQNSLYDEDWNNLNNYSFDTIMNSNYYTQDLVRSWRQESTLQTGCHSICAKQCNVKGIPKGVHLHES